MQQAPLSSAEKPSLSFSAKHLGDARSTNSGGRPLARPPQRSCLAPLRKQLQDRSRACPFCDESYVGGFDQLRPRAQGSTCETMLRFIAQQYGINFIIDRSVTADADRHQDQRSALERNPQRSASRLTGLGPFAKVMAASSEIAALAAVKEQRELENGPCKPARSWLCRTETKISSPACTPAVGGFACAQPATARRRSSQSSTTLAASYSGAQPEAAELEDEGPSIQGGGLLR